MDQISIFELEELERSSVNIREVRVFKRTVKQLLSYKSAIRSQIESYKFQIKREPNIEIADVYRNILKSYEEELKYIDDVVWEREAHHEKD